MDYEQYISELLGLKEYAETNILSKSRTLESEIYRIANKFIDQNFDVVNGAVSPERAASKLNKFTAYLQRELGRSDKLEKIVTGYVKDIRKSDDLIFKFQKDFNGVNATKASFNSVREMVLGEIMQEFEGAGMNQYLVQPMRDSIYRSIARGDNLAQMRQNLLTTIKGTPKRNGAVKRYLTNINQKGIDTYISAVNQKMMKEFGFDAMIMAGSLIKNSSPQCVHAIKKLNAIIRKKDWRKLRGIAVKNGLIPGTTFETLPFNRLHYGCRHEFTPTYWEDVKAFA